MKHKERLDQLLVQRGLCESRSKAQAVIMAGQVYVDGQKCDKAGTSVEDTADIEVRGNHCPFVSRGGSSMISSWALFALIKSVNFNIGDITPYRRKNNKSKHKGVVV